MHWTGKGQDGDKDLIAIETAKGPIENFKRTWLINCKHYAGSGKSVSVKELNNITDACKSIGATGFLLICSTQPTSSLINRFKELSEQNDIIFNYWDAIELERRLFLLESFSLIHRFFPQSSQHIGWKIYNTYSPSFWAAKYKDYFVYMGCRCSHVFPELTDIEQIFKIIEKIELPKNDIFKEHFVRPRAIFFDDKHGQFTVFIDYMISNEEISKLPSIKIKIRRFLDENTYLYFRDGSFSNCINWQISFIECDQYDDKFNVDNINYYEPFIRNFQYGVQRDSDDEDYF